MILMELGTVPNLALPLAQFKEHLCLGTGFEDESLQDDLLETYLRSAISTIEGHCGKVLLQKQFLWQLTKWATSNEQILPARPVTSIDSVIIEDASGASTGLNADSVGVVGRNGQYGMKSLSGSLPGIPSGGVAEVTFTAGFGTVWSSIPSDLAHATLVLAANYYENRGGSKIPEAVNSVLAMHRPLRLGVTR